MLVRRLLRLCALALFTTFVAFSGGRASAQTQPLFTPLPESAATPAQAGYLRTLQQKPTTSSLQLVRVNLGALQGDTTIIPLPDLGPMQALRRKTIVRGASDFTWIGDMQGTGGQAIL